ncbi:hypothetical protein [Streptomyces acidiscabies]|uniref:hypothetical protein n=1 Tax=Streptomyces acidiscabies TaxID=42234 RepID=UPI0009515099|nr:hypothetical protein [Streptomyces acidiscabies]
MMEPPARLARWQQLPEATRRQIDQDIRRGATIAAIHTLVAEAALSIPDAQLVLGDRHAALSPPHRSGIEKRTPPSPT